MRLSEASRTWQPIETIRPYRWIRQGRLEAAVRQLGYGLGSIFFISNPWIGLILWAALFANLRFGLFALLGLGAGFACKYLLRLGDAPGQGGGIKANALLAAVALAWLTSAVSLPWWVQIILAVMVGGVAAIVTSAIMAVLDNSRFPVMAAGYCLVASCLFMVCPNCTVFAASTMLPWPQPGDTWGWFESFIRSLGGLVYSPTLAFGGLVCLAMLLWSRAAFLTGVIAWCSGVLAGLAFQALGFQYYYLPLSYNFFLVGVALGAVLFLPNRKTLLVALVGGAICAFVGLTLQAVFAGGAISYLPISSMLTIWLGIGALTLAGKQAAVQRYSSSRFPPEVAWCRQAALAQRFGESDPLLAIPLIGPLRISQGFAGGITHAGAWSHAFDFQRANLDGNAAVDSSESIWGAPVLSPVAGIVERVRNDVPDNPLGGSNFADNWGNHVVIRLDQDGWLLLAHLMSGSILVGVGTRVEPGTLLGRVGNSGRSPVPHLHLQTQVAALVGAPTKAFKLANYLAPDNLGAWLRWTASGIPESGSLLMAAAPNPQVYGLLSTMMPGSAVWFCSISGEVPARLAEANAEHTSRITVGFDEAGRYRFDSGKGGRLLASLDPDAWRITELERVQSSLLRFLGMAAPSIPYAAQVGMTWDDVPPQLVSGMGFSDSLSPFLGKRFPQGHYECLEVPQSQGAIVVKARLAAENSLSPTVLTCRFEPLRGPVFLRAEFPSGAIEYSLLSFEPGLARSEN